MLTKITQLSLNMHSQLAMHYFCKLIFIKYEIIQLCIRNVRIGGDLMSKTNIGRDFLFSDDYGFIKGDENGTSHKYADGSGY